METKANYIVTGLFTLAVIVGAFAFVFWFQNSHDSSDRLAYRVVFDGSVSGLSTGAAVTFNGIRVGEVSALSLDAHDPRKVVAMLAVDRSVPVRVDTKAGLAFQGLTGLAQVSLAGGAADAAPLVAHGGEPPTIVADASATADVTEQAREVLARIDGLVADNETALHLSLHNIETITSTMAQNSERLNDVMAGLQNLVGGADGNGQIGQAADSIRHLADDLDKRTDEISTGLVQFSNSGLKQFEAFAVDGRHTLAELNKAIKNLDQHPTRLLFGR
ncbi:MAG TPA: MlaD family protein [Xanthobacteraceae bacterium]|jgi:phospholipid/cholesterol/gamma-HCH transport system substrate-binding protein